MSSNDSKLTYSAYLKIEELLSLQKPVTKQPAHEETLFIIVHQAYELWFKQILHELDSVLNIFKADYVDEKSLGLSVARLERIVQIEKLMIEQLKVLETMTPLDFLDFRDALTGASGFQSWQFRLFENKLGVKSERRLKYAERDYHHDFSKTEKEVVVKSEKDITLLTEVERWLERTPFLEHKSYNFLGAYRDAYRKMVEAHKTALKNSSKSSEEYEIRSKMVQQGERYVEQLLHEETFQELRKAGKINLSYKAYMAALFINLYRDEPLLHMPFRFLSELIEVDEYLSLWRYHHSQMVLRMIGAHVGTGGSSGHDYLKATIEQHRVFLDLFHLSTLLIPRSEIPPLAKEVQEQLRFHFGNAK